MRRWIEDIIGVLLILVALPILIFFFGVAIGIAP